MIVGTKMQNECKLCGSFAMKTYDKELDLCDLCFWKTKYKELEFLYKKLKSCSNCAFEGMNCKECKRFIMIPKESRGNKDLWVNKYIKGATNVRKVQVQKNRTA